MTALPVPQSTIDFLRLAKSLGVPRDSIERFLKAGYVPQPKQLQLHGEMRACDHNDVDEIMFGGARGGAKTHGVFAGSAIDDCQKFDNLRVLFLRKQQGSAEESLDDLTRKILFRTPHEKKQSSIKFPNHSYIKIGNFQYEKDIDKFLSLEFDLIIIEQAEQLTPTKLVDIGTCNRNSRPDYKPRMYLTVNPGGVAHTYLKNKFIQPWREGKETNTRFIQSLYTDNKFLDKGYKNKLEALTGWKRRAWLDGDWDVFAGQFFDKFRFDQHTFDDSAFFTPDYLAANWQNVMPWGAFDYGYKHWSVFYFGYKYDGTIYVVDECAVRLQLVPQIAQSITETCARWNLKPSQLANIAAGSDCFATNSQTGDSIADAMAHYGIYLNPAKTSRTARASKILTLIGDAEQGIDPTVKINRRCRMLIEQLAAMQHNPDKAGDVLKTNADDNGFGGDDSYDAFGYFVMDDTDSTGIF